jgi:hypothetical protein
MQNVRGLTTHTWAEVKNLGYDYTVLSSVSIDELRKLETYKAFRRDKVDFKIVKQGRRFYLVRKVKDFENLLLKSTSDFILSRCNFRIVSPTTS